MIYDWKEHVTCFYSIIKQKIHNNHLQSIIRNLKSTDMYFCVKPTETSKLQEKLAVNIHWKCPINNHDKIPF